MTPMTPPQNLSENTMPTSVSGSDFRFARYHGFLNVSMTRLNLVGFRLSKMDPGNNFLGRFIYFFKIAISNNEENFL